MSHNKIKVGGQSPNTFGEISVALNDLSNVSAGSPDENQVLQYSSGSWIPASRGSQAEKEIGYSFIGKFTGTYGGGTGNYSTSTVFNRFQIRVQGGDIEQNGVNHIGITFSSSAWKNGFQFTNTGTYLIFMSLQHYGTGEAIWRFYDETNSAYFGPKFRMSNSTDRMPVLVLPFTVTSTNQQLSLRLLSNATPSAVGRAQEMRAVSINIYKL
tara:strand:- start:30313 stop:30948 length:636 start_codon:yes stop_codon:yes gene_type:complete